jgi:hypothetical protein
MNVATEAAIAIFTHAFENELMVAAKVRLKNGERRERYGIVANVTPSHVTFFESEKGFRTTPLELVEGVGILHDATRTSIAVLLAKMEASIKPKQEAQLGA